MFNIEKSGENPERNWTVFLDAIRSLPGNTSLAEVFDSVVNGPSKNYPSLSAIHGSNSEQQKQVKAILRLIRRNAGHYETVAELRSAPNQELKQIARVADFRLDLIRQLFPYQNGDRP